MNARKVTLALLCSTLFAASAGAADWIFDQSQYSNDKSGKRVEQYKKVKTPTLVPYDQYFSNSGPGAYIPYGYYEEQLGLSEGLYGGFGSIGGSGIGGGMVPGAYGPVAF